MALREILSDFRDEGPPAVPKFRQPHVRAARLELASKFTEADALPAIVELEDVANRLAEAAEFGSLRDISRRDWSKAAWCLWLPNHELVNVSVFLKAYLARIFQADRKSQYKKLLSAYLRDYDPAQASFQQIGAFLAQGVRRWDWVWADRQRDFQLFKNTGPGIVATACLSSDKSIDAFLESIGLGGDIGLGGFATESYKFALAKLQKKKNEDYHKALRRIIDWSIDNDTLRYSGAEGALADALLLPWANANPAKTTQQKIENFLLNYYKDPRVVSVTGSKWSHVSPDTKSVMLRWLVGAALEQFLQVVDKVAMPSQWRYRRAFWMAYYNAGVIDEAWVAFAWQGQIQARKSFGDKKGFGNLAGGGVSRDHAVLIMKIGGITIADWSHNGKCHIWTQSMKRAPKLYRKEYHRDNLVIGSSNGGVVHAGAPNGTWQAKVASYIARHTGVRLAWKDYMPKGRR